MTVRDALERTSTLLASLRAREQRPWTIEALSVELSAEVGTLADSVMIKEGYRKLRPGQDVDLEDDIADVLFVVFAIALHYGVDVGGAYESMVASTHAKLDDVRGGRA